jgi:PAS domain S-box-containing protein
MKLIPFSRLSIRQRLPLLVCSLLLSVILIFGLISYLGVKKAAMKVGEERLRTLSQQLSTMLGSNTHSLISTTYNAANKPSVRSYVLSRGKDSMMEVRKVLADLQKDTSYVKTELRDARNLVILDTARKGIGINIPVDALLAEMRHPKLDSGQIGKIYAFGDSVFYPIVATITENGRLAGYLIRWRMMIARSGSVDQLTQLMGTDARLYIGNVDGSLWTDMIRPVPPPPVDEQNKKQVIQYARSGKTVLSSIHAINNSEWLVAIEFPKDKILQAADTFLYWLIIAGAALLVVGIFFGWLMSRNISEPLAKLTTATSEIAAGIYSSPVFVSRLDEIGKLARSFNAMTAQVESSQRALEHKADNYKMLFEKNPMPMWIMCKSTLDILDVNEAAILHYGYSREEFLKLNSKDIRPQEDLGKFLSVASRVLDAKNKHGIWRHKKKDGTIIMVDLIADDIVYKNRPARLTLAHDVTEKLKAEAELVRHRIMQQEIITETTILVQEKEREEIGKELHDNINQILASTKLYLELARGENRDMFPEAISKSYENINLAIGEIRQLSKQLVRPSLETTLKESLGDLAHEIKAITPIDINFVAHRFDEESVNENVKLMIYRVVQEQINNILKYAAASEVQIQIETDPEHVYLKISDNGVGFDTSQKSKGIGLRNIHNRVKFHKGFSTVLSRPGEGCTIEISVPLNNPIMAAI